MCNIQRPIGALVLFHKLRLNICQTQKILNIYLVECLQKKEKEEEKKKKIEVLSFGYDFIQRPSSIISFFAAFPVIRGRFMTYLTQREPC